MHRYPSVVVVLVLCFQLVPLSPAGGDGSARAPEPLATGHLGSIVLSNFTSARMDNVTVRKDGAVQLNRSRDYYALDQFQVSPVSKASYNPSVAVNSKNEFLVTWEGSEAATGYDVFMQRYDQRGIKLGNQVTVCNATGHQTWPTVAVDSKDNRLVAWQDARSSSQPDIYARLFDPNGSAIGDELRICVTAGYQERPTIAAGPNDTYIVTWQDSRSGDPILWFQRLDGIGGRLGEPTSTGYVVSLSQNVRPRLDVDSKGNFVITWQSNYFHPMAQRFNETGAKLGNVMQLNTTKTMQEGPDIKFDSNDNFTVAWADDRNGNLNPKIYAQRFNDTGTMLDTSFLCSNTIDENYDPSIAFNTRDDLMVTWHDLNRAPSSVYFRSFNESGAPLGPASIVARKNTDLQNPVIGLNSNDSFMIVWIDYNTGTIYARPYLCPFVGSGNLTTGTVTCPDDFWMWNNISANSSYENAAKNSLDLMFSTDNGTSWLPVPANGSLEQAGKARELRIRAGFTSTDNLTSPRLFNITLNYTSNLVPSASLPPDFSTFRNSNTSISVFASDEDGDLLTYAWAQAGGQAVGMNGADTTEMAFTPRSSGLFSFRVTVNDGYNESLPAVINITVINRIPAVSAGPDLFAWKNSLVNLNATGDDPDSDLLDYTWTQVAGDFSYLTGQGGPGVSFPASRTGSFAFQVVASDGENESLPSLVNLTVWSRPPSAVLEASSTNVTFGYPVIFNASGSNDSDGNITAYNFRFGDGNESGWGPNSISIHTFGAPGKYNATVEVRDEDGNYSTSEGLEVLIWSPPPPPPELVPRITITSPSPGQRFNVSELTVSFTLENFTASPGAGWILFQMDSGPERNWTSGEPCTFTNLSNGNHALRAQLVNASDVRLTNTEATAFVSFVVELPVLPARADLSVLASDIQLEPSRPTASDTITVSVKVLNRGAGGAGTFGVRYLLDGARVGDDNISSLAVGASTVLWFSLKASAGAHELKIVIDASNIVAEENESNNEAVLEFKVASKSSPVSPSTNWGLIAAAAAIVALVLVALLVVSRRRKRTVVILQPQQYSQPGPAATSPGTPAPPPIPLPVEPPSPPPQAPPVPPPVPPPESISPAPQAPPPQRPPVNWQ